MTDLKGRNNKNKISRRLALGMVAVTLLLAGCGDSAEDGSTSESANSSLNSAGTTVQESAADTGGDGNLAETNKGEGPGDSNNTSVSETAPAVETAADAATILPEELQSGEQVLAGADAVQVPLQGQAPELDLNWDNMRDAVGWLIIPGTEISTGIMQAEGKDRVWLDGNNSTDFSDPQTVLHGSFLPGEPLEQVTAYEDEQFFQQNPYLYVYTPNGQVLEYKVFACYQSDHEDILVNHNAFDYDQFGQYIDSIYQQRSLTAVTDESLHDSVISTWQVLTIDAEGNAGEQDVILQGTLTGQETENTD